jgi:hypothetical protein
LIFIGHHAMRVTPIAMAAFSLTLFAFSFFVHGWPTALALPTVFVFIPAYIATNLVVMYHNVRLCTYCVASMPLDPGRVVDRRPWLMYINHVSSQWYALLGVTIWALACVKLTGMDRWGVLMVPVPVSLRQLSEVRHRRYQPWCPWCNDDDDGDDPGPEPEPDDPHGKRLPLPATKRN